MEGFSAQFVALAILIAASIGASVGVVLGGSLAAGKVADLEMRIRHLESVLNQSARSMSHSAIMSDLA